MIAFTNAPIIPVSFVNNFTIEQATTSETKCGIYVQFWITLPSLALLSSFRRSARTIGAGKPNARHARLILIVLIKSSPNLGDWKNFIKCSQNEVIKCL